MDRLFGQETEYAIRFTPLEGHDRPHNALIYDALQHGIQKLVATQKSDRYNMQKQFFVENGGTFNYEYLPYAPKWGLIEGATPECYSPGELLLYQKAQESLLIQAKPYAERYLEDFGFQGELGLIKNCRDVEGHTYGAQENYEANLTTGWKLFIYRMGVFLFFLPIGLFFLAYSIVTLGFILTALSFVTLYFILLGVLKLFSILTSIRYVADTVEDWGDRIWYNMTDWFESEKFKDLLILYEYRLTYPIISVIVAPYLFWQRAFAFKGYRKALTAFFISRPIMSGAGSLVSEDCFALSEKGVALKRLFRSTLGPNQRPLFDSGNLLKEVVLATSSLFLLRLDPFKRLFKQRQRLQIGLSDSNRSQMAEYLKVSTTLLMLKLHEKGYLKKAPRIKKPIKAFHILNLDPSLKAKVSVSRGMDLSALDLQKWYLQQARQWIQESPEVEMEYIEVVKLWAEVLGLLEEDPGELIGRLDWVSKRYLLETSGKDKSYMVKKKIDIGYHELETGYLDKLEREGIAPKLVSEDEIEEAIKKPSSPRKVRLRSRLIRSIAYNGLKAKVSWNSVQIGTWKNRKVIDLNKIRKKSFATNGRKKTPT
ncbi:MAG: hypothetical protein IEMM0008_1193 [bacterium]|nr:MAG: hypothetical protein IEMM0008_1193 [bacterium]